MNIAEIKDVRVAELPLEGPKLSTERDASDLVGELYGTNAGVVAIPVERLAPDFFRLGSTLAGLFIQKLQNYGYRLAVVGDISGYLATSEPLRAFVRECRRGDNPLFVNDMAELMTRL